MAPGENDRSVSGNVHGLELVTPGLALSVIGIPEGLESDRDLTLEVEQPLAIDLAVGHGVSRRSLLHELGKDPGGVGVVPLSGKLVEDPVAERPPLPEGDDLGGESFDVLGGDLVARQLARAKDLEVLDAVAGDLGIGRGRLRFRSPLTDDEFAVAQIEALVGAEVVERAGAHERRRPAALVLPVEPGQQQRPLDGDRWDGFKALAT